MQIRALAVVAFPILAIGLQAQTVRRTPRVGGLGGNSPLPSYPDPEMPATGRALAQQRSRWSSEGFTTLSSVELPTVAGIVQRYTTFGTGLREAHRFTDQFSATLDMTASMFGDPERTQTVELGGVYRPIAEHLRVQPFVGLRGAYIHLSSTFVPATDEVNGFGAAANLLAVSQLSHGVGGAGAAGVDITLTSRLALTTELSAMRSQLEIYQTSSALGFPVGKPYTTNSYRLMLGIKYNPMRSQNLKQSPAR